MITDEQIEQVTEALHRIGTQLKNLGTADAATDMGAIEAHAMEVAKLAEATDRVAYSLAEGFEKVSDGLLAIAGAINRHTDAQS